MRGYASERMCFESQSRSEMTEKVHVEVKNQISLSRVGWLDQDPGLHMIIIQHGSPSRLIYHIIVSGKASSHDNLLENLARTNLG